MSNIPNVGGNPATLQDAIDDPDQGRESSQGTKHTTAADKIGSSPSRASLRLSAGWWRTLQYMGSSVHFLASPRPPKPAFVRTISSSSSSKPGDFKLHFYTPKGYQSLAGDDRTFPAVINFHGGGFTLGSGTDDARFARFVVDTCGALFISVDYRLAPEYPFPTAVEDGADALLYVIRHAAELRIEPFQLATSGFSAGGNIAITSTLCLAARLEEASPASTPAPNYRIVATATWYPIIDCTISRAQRRATATGPDKALPAYLTDLFDASYLYPPDLDLANPYLSPAKASDEQLAKVVPRHVLLYTCEWDMLLREGQDFARRLAASPINKSVHYKMIPGVPHGWDKGPSPLAPPERSQELYQECCEKLREIFGSG